MLLLYLLLLRVNCWLVVTLLEVNQSLHNWGPLSLIRILTMLHNKLRKLIWFLQRSAVITAIMVTLQSSTLHTRFHSFTPCPRFVVVALDTKSVMRGTHRQRCKVSPYWTPDLITGHRLKRGQWRDFRGLRAVIYPRQAIRSCMWRNSNSLHHKRAFLPCLVSIG